MSKGLEIFEIPSKVLFGPGALSRLPHILKKFNSRGKILVLTGKVHSKHYAEKVLQSSPDLNVELEIVYQGDVTEIENILAKYSKTNISVVVGVGGGKVIDVAKTVAYLTDRPVISVPTTASHDGISSPYVSYVLQLDLRDRLGVGKVYKVPYAIIADTEIVQQAPRRFLLSGIGEIMGKIIAVKDWELAHKLKGEEFSEFAARLSLSSYEIINKNIDKLKVHDQECVRLVVKALIGCGVAMAIAGSSRPCSGSEHMFCHALDVILRERGEKGGLHGEQVALGTIMMAYLHGLNWRKIRQRMASLGIPTTAQELGLDRDLIIEALLRAHKIRPDRYTILGSDGLTRKAAIQLVEATGVA